MNKENNRSNVLIESISPDKNVNFLHSIINALAKGYSEKTIFFDIIDLVRREQISDGVLKTVPEALRAYAKSFSKTLDYVADKLDKIVDFRETTKKKETPEEDTTIKEETPDDSDK